MTFTQVFGGTTIYPAGVSYRAIALSANQTLAWPVETATNSNVVAQIMDVTPSAASLSVLMPPANEASVGETALFFNAGSYTFTVKDNGGNTIVSISPGLSYQVYLIGNSTVNGTWRSTQYAAGTSSATAGSLVGAGIKAINTSLNQSMGVTNLNSNYTIGNDDRSEAFVWTGGAGTLTLPSAATVGNDWFCHVRNSGNGAISLTPVGSDQINGSTTLGFNPGDSAIVICDGSNFFTIGFGQSATFAFDYVSIDLTSQTSPYTLAGANLNRIAYSFGGVLAANMTIYIPATFQQYWLSNETSGGYSITVKVAGQTGVTIGNGVRAICYCNGTDLVDADTASFSFPVTIAQGGTGATDASGARINLGGTSVGISVFTAANATAGRTALSAAALGANSDITSLSGLTTPLSVSQGGTGAATLTGYVKGTGTTAMTASATVPVADISGTFGVAQGGTGQTSYVNGELLIGNTTGNTLTKSTLTAGTNVSITNGTGSITINASDQYTGTVTSVAALTLGTTGTDLSSSVANSTTTPVITLNVPTASATNRGALNSTDWSTFNGKQAALVSGSNIKTVAGTSLLGAGDVGTIGATYGGTGQTSYTVGDILYASTTTALSKLADVATGNALISGGVGVAPSYGKIGLTTHVSGTLPVANGGTGQTSYTNGQLLIGNTTGNTLALGTLTAGSGVSITNGAGTITIAATGSGGSVTSVDVSGGTTGLTTSGGPVTGAGTITLAGTLNAANGGTGQSSYTVGDILYASTSTALSKLADVATGNALISGGVGVAPSYGKIGLTTHVSGTLGIGNGGTGVTTTPTNGQLLIGNGTGYSVAAITAGSGITVTNSAGGITIGSTASGGTVTSVSFTGGIVSVATPTTTPAFTIAGTSGGIPYFSSASTWASSAALAANAIVVGGGAGVSPATITTGTGVVTALGVNTGSAGAFVVNGGALGTPSSGTLTNATGLPISTGVSGLGTSVGTALGVAVGTAGSFVVNGGALGTPSSGTLTNCTFPTLNQNTTGSAGSVTNSVTFNNGGSGAASGTTFNGSAAQTISYNTIGAPSTTGTGASGSWGISVTGSSASCTGNAATATTATTANALNTSNSYTAVGYVSTVTAGTALQVGDNSGVRNFGTGSTIYMDVAGGSATAGSIVFRNTSSFTTMATFGGTGSQLTSLGVGTGPSGTSGEIRATNNVTAYYSSDARLKENVQPIENALDVVSAVGGKTFDWTDEYIADHGGEDGYFVRKSDFGVIAQDVEAVFPLAVRTREDGTKAVDYEKLVAVAFAAIVELKAEVAELRQQAVKVIK